MGTLKSQSNGPLYVQHYGNWYSGRWWVDCYIWYSEDGHGQAAAPPSPILAVPNVMPTHQRPVHQLRIIRCAFAL